MNEMIDLDTEYNGPSVAACEGCGEPVVDDAIEYVGDDELAFCEGCAQEERATLKLEAAEKAAQESPRSGLDAELDRRVNSGRTK